MEDALILLRHRQGHKRTAPCPHDKSHSHLQLCSMYYFHLRLQLLVPMACTGGLSSPPKGRARHSLPQATEHIHLPDGVDYGAAQSARLNTAEMHRGNHGVQGAQLLASQGAAD